MVYLRPIDPFSSSITFWSRLWASVILGGNSTTGDDDLNDDLGGDDDLNGYDETAAAAPPGSLLESGCLVLNNL